MSHRIWDIPFVVIDVETTGADPVKNRVMEIACVTVQGGEIISEFSSLVNPHQFIPSYIQVMTGISNELAFTGPEADVVFESVAKILRQKNAVFVAHNARFDWSFVYHSFVRSEIKPVEMPNLCTLKLSRRLLPSKLKKGLTSLIQFYNLRTSNRHRAFGDAEATAQILTELLDEAETAHEISTVDELLKFQNRAVRYFISSPAAHKRVEEKLKTLPDEPGVYYFRNKEKEIIYVGKAKCLADRVSSYFQPSTLTTRKMLEMVNSIYEVEWQTTDTELAALLLESKEIKRHQSRFNVMSRNYGNFPFIRITPDEFPRIEMTFDFKDGDGEYFGPFRSSYLVHNIISTIEKEFKLCRCDKPAKFGDDKKPCFYHQIDKCFSPCSDYDARYEYAKEIEKVRYFLSGYENGIIKQLENKMQSEAEDLNFEKASVIRDQIRQLKTLFDRREVVPTSINKNNLILILPASEKARTVEVFFIKTGKLIHQLTTGRKADLSLINNMVHEFYFNGTPDSLDFTREDIDELKIICSWIYKKQTTGNFVYVENRTEPELISEIGDLIRSISFGNEEESSPEFHDGKPEIE